MHGIDTHKDAIFTNTTSKKAFDKKNFKEIVKRKIVLFENSARASREEELKHHDRFLPPIEVKPKISQIVDLDLPEQVVDNHSSHRNEPDI